MGQKKKHKTKKKNTKKHTHKKYGKNEHKRHTFLFNLFITKRSSSLTDHNV